MAYDERLAGRVRHALAGQLLAGQLLVEEKILFQGLAFMVQDKLCICVRDNMLLCRIGPDGYEAALDIPGVEPMMMNGRAAIGYVYVSPQAYASQKAFSEWISQCLAFNKFAKRSKK